MRILISLAYLIAGCAIARLAAAASSSVSFPFPGNATVLFEWKHIDFAFDDPALAAEYTNNKYYEDVLAAGIKIWTPPPASFHSSFPQLFPISSPLSPSAPMSAIFISCPRWKSHVPATLSVIQSTATGYALRAYPSWSMNRVGDSQALQSVLGFEIDSYNRLWLLDQGKVNNQDALSGSIKLIIWDLLNNQEIKRYLFTETQASLRHSFLNDIVVDTNTMTAYITDSGISTQANTSTISTTQGGLIVYDYASNSARRVLDSHISVQANSSFRFSINNTRVNPPPYSPMMTGADGIALTPDGHHLFYCPLSSRHLYRIPTSVLRDFKSSDSSIISSVIDCGEKLGNSDGITFTNRYNRGEGSDDDAVYELILGDLEHSSVYDYTYSLSSLSNITSRSPSSALIHTDDHDQQHSIDFEWVDTFGYDHTGALVFLSNHLQKFTGGYMKFDTDVNFRIVSVYIEQGVDSYLSMMKDGAGGGGSNGNDWISSSEFEIMIMMILIVFGVFGCMGFVYYHVIKHSKEDERRRIAREQRQRAHSEGKYSGVLNQDQSVRAPLTHSDHHHHHHHHHDGDDHNHSDDHHHGHAHSHGHGSKSMRANLLENRDTRSSMDHHDDGHGHSHGHGHDHHSHESNSSSHGHSHGNFHYAHDPSYSPDSGPSSASVGSFGGIRDSESIRLSRAKPRTSASASKQGISLLSDSRAFDEHDDHDGGGHDGASTSSLESAEARWHRLSPNLSATTLFSKKVINTPPDIDI